MQATNCLNCATSLGVSDHFCAQCGQAARQHRLNLAHLAHETAHFFTHADKGFLYLIKGLATQPGVVIRGYIDGQRKKYFSPLQFFFIVIGFFLLAVTTFHTLEATDIGALKKEVAQNEDAVVRARRLAKLERAEKGAHFAAKYSNYINFFVTPLAALVFYLFYLRNRYNYTEHLVANLYINGFNGLVFILLLVPYNLLTRGTPYYFWGLGGYFLFQVFYRTTAYYRFLNKRGVGAYFYTLLASLVIVGGWFLLSSLFMRYYIDHGF